MHRKKPTFFSIYCVRASVENCTEADIFTVHLNIFTPFTLPHVKNLFDLSDNPIIYSCDFFTLEEYTEAIISCPHYILRIFVFVGLLTAYITILQSEVFRRKIILPSLRQNTTVLFCQLFQFVICRWVFIDVSKIRLVDKVRGCESIWNCGGYLPSCKDFPIGFPYRSVRTPKTNIGIVYIKCSEIIRGGFDLRGRESNPLPI